jgi:hypothetical protein
MPKRDFLVNFTAIVPRKFDPIHERDELELMLQDSKPSFKMEPVMT